MSSMADALLYLLRDAVNTAPKGHGVVVTLYAEGDPEVRDIHVKELREFLIEFGGPLSGGSISVAGFDRLVSQGEIPILLLHSEGPHDMKLVKMFSLTEKGRRKLHVVRT